MAWPSLGSRRPKRCEMAFRRESRSFEVTFGAGGFLFLVMIGLAVGGGAFGVGYWLGREHGVPVVTTPAKPDLSLIRDPLAPRSEEKGNHRYTEDTKEEAGAGRGEQPPKRKERQGRNIFSSDPGALGVLAVDNPAADAEGRAREVRREVIARPSAVSVRPGITATKRVYTVQVKSVPTRAEADSFATRIRAAGFVPFVVQAEIKKKKWFRVRVGEFETADEAEAARKKLVAIARDAIVSHEP